MLMFAGVVAATSYTWYPQEWTTVSINDAGTTVPVSSGSIQYKLQEGVTVKPNINLPNDLPGFTDFYWTGGLCEVRFSNDITATTYDIKQYNAVLKYTSNDSVISTAYIGCPLYSNFADFNFAGIPEQGAEYVAYVSFEDANTAEQVAYSDNLEFGKPEVEEPIVTELECRAMARRDGMDFDLCSGFYDQSEWFDLNWDFENDYVGYQCYNKCRRTGDLPFDNCAQYYGKSYSEDRYGYYMSYFEGKGYCDWVY